MRHKENILRERRTYNMAMDGNFGIACKQCFQVSDILSLCGIFRTVGQNSTGGKTQTDRQTDNQINKYEREFLKILIAYWPQAPIQVKIKFKISTYTH